MDTHYLLRSENKRALVKEEGEEDDSAFGNYNDRGSLPQNDDDPAAPSSSSQCCHYGGISGSNDRMPPTVKLKVYKRRWLIMTLFGSFTFCQAFIWNTWGPIASSAIEVFRWTNSTIALLSALAPLAYIPSGFLFPWLLQVKGLRWAILTSSIAVSAGALMRVFTSEPETATTLIYIGHFTAGLGGPMAMCAAPAVSATWFPPHERVTATALGTTIMLLGVSAPFLVDLLIQKERDEIMRYMYYSCGFCWLMTLVVLVYFPAKPPQPPALSAVCERESYWAGLWALRRKSGFIGVGLSFAFSNGFLNGWASVLDVNLKPYGITQIQAGWIGFYCIIGGAILSLLLGSFVAYFTRLIKHVIIGLFSLATVMLVLFVLMLEGIIPFSIGLLSLTAVVACSCLGGTIPLLFEVACETAFPTGEGTANGVLTYFNNMATLLFLSVFYVPHVGTMWMNWTFLASTAVCVPLVLSLRGRFKRLEVDEGLDPNAAAAICNQEIVVEYQEVEKGGGNHGQ